MGADRVNIGQRGVRTPRDMQESPPSGCCPVLTKPLNPTSQYSESRSTPAPAFAPARASAQLMFASTHDNFISTTRSTTPTPSGTNKS
jgi:hypothetical protein